MKPRTRNIIEVGTDQPVAPIHEMSDTANRPRGKTLPDSPSTTPSYVGRFAPSPTGPLHFGSLIAALASYLDARHHRGKWLVRIEDLDTTRCKPQWTTSILHTLEELGFEWDGDIVMQSARTGYYQSTLERLHEEQLLYTCTCSRKEIGDSVTLGIEGPVYPGTCRFKQHAAVAGALSGALRVLTDDAAIEFDDRVQGRMAQRIESQIGDFIVLRKDGLFAYQLAVVVDDALQGVNQVVRGADLLDSTARQIYLQRQLGFSTPAYLHVPLAVNEQGQKLSKQTLAAAVSASDAASNLIAALQFLGQDTTDAAQADSRVGILNAAVQNWRSDAIARVRALPFNLPISFATLRCARAHPDA